MAEKVPVNIARIQAEVKRLNDELLQRQHRRDDFVAAEKKIMADLTKRRDQLAGQLSAVQKLKGLNPAELEALHQLLQPDGVASDESVNGSA